MDEDIAAFVRLFDQLIAFVSAVETWHQTPHKKRCPKCNRNGNPAH